MVEKFSRNASIEMAPMKDETVLFNPGLNKFCVLNATAAFIWESLATPQSVAEIVAGLAVNFAKVDAQRARDEVESVLAELEKIECVARVGAELGV